MAMKMSCVVLFLSLFCVSCLLSVAADNADRVLLTEAARTKGALCLDGTAPAYYLKKGSGTGLRKWYIHHEGGGWCSSLPDCYGRSQTNLGSSKTYPPTANLDGGYFSSDQRVNPQMYNWNMVYMKYCDGGSFSGDNATITRWNNHPLFFRGRRILQAMRDDLFNTKDLKSATDVVISGCSAGGLATFLHLDWWRDVLPTSTHVVGMPDSGFFLDYENPIKRYHSSMIWTFEMMACESGVNDACVAAWKPKGQAWKCFFAQHTSPFIQTPIFPLQSVYDSWQISEDLNSKEPGLINQWGKTLADLVNSELLRPHDHNGIFLDSCFHHCGEWGAIRIDGQNQAQAFQNWYEGSQKKIFFQDMAYPCSACCHSDSETQ